MYAKMTPLGDADRNFMESVKHVETPIGYVAIIGFSMPIPPGWRMLRLDEGR